MFFDFTDLIWLIQIKWGSAMLLGNDVGNAIGLSDGQGLGFEVAGCKDGSEEVGLREGVEVGLEDTGVLVGFPEGMLVVGFLEGVLDGILDGLLVGQDKP